MLKSDEYSLSIALTSLPFKGGGKFYINEFKEGIYKRYRERASEILNQNNEELSDANLFKPVAYGLFGRYDCAILNLSDDSIFNSRMILPFSSLSKNQDPDSFDYQLLNGIHSFPVDIKNSKSNSKEEKSKFDGYNKLVSKASNTFLKLLNYDKSNKNLLGICQLKLNSALVIGNGGYLNMVVYKHIVNSLKEFNKNILKKKKGKKADIKDTYCVDFILLESYGYSEFILLIFGNSASTIMDSTLKIRETKLSDLKLKEESLNKIKVNTLLNELSDGKDFSNNHIFESSVTELGFNLDLLYADSNSIGLSAGNRTKISEQLSKVNDLYAQISYSIKPGHLQAFLSNTATKNKKTQDYNLRIGLSDILYNVKGKRYSFPSLIEILKKEYERNDNNITGIKTIVSFSRGKLGSLIDSNFDPGKHIAINQNIAKNILIKKEVIARIKFALRRLGVSIVCSQRIISMISNYNQSISNDTLYGSFLETSGFLKGVVINTILELSSRKKDLENIRFYTQEIEDILTKLTDNFEAAFLSRYFHSLPTYDITNFNFLYKSSVQQLLTSADLIFKLSSAIMSPSEELSSLVFLSGKSDTRGYMSSLRMNFYHIFHPELLLSSSIHEASNFFLTNLFADIFSVRPDLNFEQKSDDRSILFNFISVIKSCNLNKEIKSYNNPSSIDLFIEEFDIPTIENFGEFSEVYSQHVKHEKEIPNQTNLEIFKEMNWSDFWGYIIRDLLTFRIGYASDLKLFNFWHWVHFLQTPSHYLNYSRFNEFDLVSFSMRMLVINCYLNYKIQNNSDDKNYTIPNSSFECFCPSLERQWNDLILPLSKAVKSLCKDEKVMTMLDGIDSFAIWWRDLKLNRTNEELKFVNININKKIKKLADGRIPYVGRDWTRKKHYNVFLETKIAYLKITMALFEDGNLDDMESWISGSEKQLKRQFRVLQRDFRDGQPSVEIMQGIKTSPISIDPRGGLFLSTSGVRKEYLRLGTTAHKFFWHQAQILKREYYLSQIEER